MTNEEKRNIYNNIQNLYNMDFTSWQEVLAIMYTYIDDISSRLERVENNLKYITLVSPNGAVYKVSVTDLGEIKTELLSGVQNI